MIIPRDTVTHTQIIAGSRMGKSKLIEGEIRQDMKEDVGTITIDPHGPLAWGVLEHCAEYDIGLDDRKVVVVFPEMSDRVMGLDMFRPKKDGDLAALVADRLETIVRAWGGTNYDAMPTYESAGSDFLEHVIGQEVLVTSAVHLFRYKNSALRAAKGFEDWNGLTRREFEALVLAIKNRMNRFVKSKTVRRMVCAPAADVERGIAEGWHLIYHLGKSRWLARPSARLIGSVVLNDVFDVAMQRKEKTDFRVYIDEFEKFISPELCEMLDEMAKSRVLLILAHHHLTQLAKQEGLLASIFSNARNRIVMGGINSPDCEILAKEMFISRVVEKAVKDKRTQRFTTYEERIRKSRTVSKGRSTGSSTRPEGLSTHDASWEDDDGYEHERLSYTTSESMESFTEHESYNESESESTYLHPVLHEEEVDLEYSVQEKILRVAEQIKLLPKRHYFAQFDSPEIVSGKVPEIAGYGLRKDYVLDFIREVDPGTHKDVVDRMIQEHERRYLNTNEGPKKRQRNPDF